jgi:hypothetical protein
VNDKLENIWKEAVVVNFRHYFGIFLEGLRKTTKTSVRIAGLRAVKRLRNSATALKYYFLSKERLRNRDIAIKCRFFMKL